MCPYSHICFLLLWIGSEARKRGLGSVEEKRADTQFPLLFAFYTVTLNKSPVPVYSLRS